MNIMEIQNVQYAYDGKKKVLKGINTQMEQGKMYAILGPSGCVSGLQAHKNMP